MEEWRPTARSLLTRLWATRVLPARVAAFQMRALLHAYRTRDHAAYIASLRASSLALLLHVAKDRQCVVELGTAPGWTSASLVLVDRTRRVVSFDPVVQPSREGYVAMLPRQA